MENHTHHMHPEEHEQMPAAEHGRAEKHPGKPVQHNKHEHTNRAMMVSDLKRRFWISLIVTIPILALSEHIQDFLE